MFCAADLAERNRQADEADATVYSEEVERRALAFMQPGQCCDPTSPANIEIAIEAIMGDAPDAIDAYWYDRAEFKAVAEMSREVKPRYRARY